ncbi:MAG: Mur ligase family protein [Patescibacteria group bacterium]
MKTLFIRALQFLATYQIRRFSPMVIAVTGSVGKTSTKNAIAIALSSKFDVRTAKKNYNNEFGVPLAIMGEYSPGKDVWGWMKLFARQLFIKKFPKVLVLEYGADKPGDIQVSCNIAKPSIGVITAVSPVHVSNYSNFGALVEEKSTLVKNISVDGAVILNADDLTVAQMRKKAVAPVLTYGKSGQNSVITDIYTKIVEQDSYGTSDAPIITKSSIVIDGETVNLALRNVIGDAAIISCAAALLVAKRCDVPLQSAAKALNEQFSSAPGRMRPLAGIKGCLILDDSYNAAPASVNAALDVLASFKTLRSSARRIAVLGAMAELGQYSEEEHSTVARKVVSVADIFIATGPLMGVAADEAIRAGMKNDSVIRCADSVEAGRWLDANVHIGDIVLVKGSQSARMEKAVKDIVAEPLRASELLCRQEESWQNR